MNKYIVITGILLCFSGRIIGQFTELCDGSIDIFGGEYIISNNVWGTGEGVGDQCINVTADTTYFSVSLSTHNSEEVASYPFIFKGCHFGTCTDLDNPMPVKVEEISSAPFAWKVSTEGVAGTWNTAFEAWFRSSNSSFGYDAELMIWIDYAGGAAPAGQLVDRIEIGNHEWDLYFIDWDSWNYMAYKITTPADSVHLDLKDFIHDAVTRGYILTTWEMDNMEAGFEIWRDGQGLTTHSFSASVTGGAIPVNYAPAAFGLSSPHNNKTLDSLIITFRWEEAVDPNEDAVSYTLYITGSDIDTVITDIHQPEYTFNGTESLSFNTEYTWYVEASDSMEVTESNHRIFTIEEPSWIDDIIIHKQYGKIIQIYPNPSEGLTTISYELNIQGMVRLVIYDVTGREIKSVLNEYQPADNYEIPVNIKYLQKGIYFFKLQVNNSVIGIKKMVIKER